MKKKPITTKGTATQKDEKLNPLSSENWISDSSVQERSLRAGAADPLPSPSDDPCKDCHVDFFEEEVTVEWMEAPDNTYQASENVDTSGGGWTPDLWSLSPTSSGVSIDEDTGEVTFGSEGCSVRITAGVRRCRKYKKSFNFNAIQLRINYEDPNTVPPWKKTDITGQQRDVEVGNYIALSAMVTPKGFAPANGNYNWEIPADVLKDYVVTVKSNPVVPLPNADRKRSSLSFFWLNGGSKDVRVTINIKGHQFQAVTTFEVSRPENTITAHVDAQPSVQNKIPATPPL